MEYNKFKDQIVIRLDRGDEVVECLMAIAKKENVKLATLVGLGAAGKVRAGAYNVEEQKYYENTWEGEYEITNLTGNITALNGETYGHFHITIADEEGKALGGHLNEAVISGTGEIFMTVIDGEVARQKDEPTGLQVFRFK